LSLQPTIQNNEDQTSIPQNFDQRPSLMENNNIARVFLRYLCAFFSYYNFLL